MLDSTSPTPPAAGRALESLLERYLRAQLKGDRREAVRLVLDEGLARGVPVADLQIGVVQEAQREIGRLWQDDSISIAQEHMATAISQIVLAHLFQNAPATAPNGKKVVVACVEGELHDFPARLVADALDLAGFEVRFLGASVPTASLIDAVAEERPDVVALSVTMRFHEPALRTAIAALRERFGALPIAVGGGACVWSPKLAEEVGAAATGATAPELVEAVRGLLGVKA